MNKIELISKSENETKKIANIIAQQSKSGDIILLEGYLGTGKTIFVKGFAESLNYKDKVTSPTFNIANFYNTEQGDLIHLDLYRLTGIEEFNKLGIDEYFPQSIVIIEWGKKIAEYLDDYLYIFFEYYKDKEDTRKITISANNDKYSSIIKTLEKQ